MKKLYFPFVFLVELVILGAFIGWMCYTIPTLSPENYQFYGDANHVPYLDQYIGHSAVTIVRWILFAITVLLVLFMLITIIGELIRWWLNFGRKGKDYNQLPGSKDEPQIVRFKNPFKLWHYLVMIAFTLAAIVGIMQAFPSWGPGRSLLTSIGLDTWRSLHHYFCYVVDATLVYFIGYFAYKFIIKKERMRAMFPTFKDITDAIDMNLYILGLKKHEPEYGRYTFGQKIDFFLIIVGIPTLSVTGLAMHYTSISEPVITGLGIALVTVLHRSVAFFLAWFIVSVHLYYAHLAPGFFPVNTVILTGKMPISRYKALYPLDADRYLIAEQQAKAAGKHVTGPKDKLPPDTDLV